MLNKINKNRKSFEEILEKLEELAKENKVKEQRLIDEGEDYGGLILDVNECTAELELNIKLLTERKTERKSTVADVSKDSANIQKINLNEHSQSIKLTYPNLQSRNILVTSCNGRRFGRFFFFHTQ